MERDETLGILAFIYAMAFLLGSIWGVLLPSREMPVALTDLSRTLPAPGSAYYFLILPIISGLFYGTMGIAVSASMGYQNSGLFDLLVDLMRTDFLEGQLPQILPADAGLFTCYGAYFLLAVSGATLGACFSYIHEDPRAEILVSALLYLLSAAYITQGGGC